MLTEAIKTLQNSTSITPVYRDLARDDQILKTDPRDGTHEVITVEPMVTEVVETIESLAEAMPADAASGIYVGRESIKGVHNDRHGLRTVVLNLFPSPDWLFITGQTGTEALDPKDFVRDLRTTLRHAAPAGLLDRVQGVSFTQTAGATQANSRSRESLGQTITAEVTKGHEDALPEALQTFKLRRWLTPEAPERFAVEVVLDPDVARHGWTMYADPVDVADAELAHLRAMAARVAEQVGGAIPIYIGKHVAQFETEVTR